MAAFVLCLPMNPTAPASRMRARNSTIRPNKYLLTHVIGITLLLALLAEAMHYSGADMALSRLFYDANIHAFPWCTSWWLKMLGDRILLIVPAGVAMSALAAAIASYWCPRLRPWRGALWAIVLTYGLGASIISQLKHYTASPRPYHLSLFGGYANYPVHFWASNHGEAGNALPSNHAGAGYAMLSLYFAGWAMGRSTWRWGGLAIGIAVGLLFSMMRVMQGAHFFSQTLWSACLMWGLASIVFYPLIAGSTRPTDAPNDTRG
jgi:membrane-associated PAP2 superfamily phosphatase